MPVNLLDVLLPLVDEDELRWKVWDLDALCSHLCLCLRVALRLGRLARLALGVRLRLGAVCSFSDANSARSSVAHECGASSRVRRTTLSTAWARWAHSAGSSGSGSGSSWEAPLLYFI